MAAKVDIIVPAETATLGIESSNSMTILGTVFSPDNRAINLTGFGAEVFIGQDALIASGSENGNVGGVPPKAVINFNNDNANVVN